MATKSIEKEVTGRGGIRPGAGRKLGRTLPKQQYTVKVAPEIISEIDELREPLGLSRSKLIETGLVIVLNREASEPVKLGITLPPEMMIRMRLDGRKPTHLVRAAVSAMRAQRACVEDAP